MYRDSGGHSHNQDTDQFCFHEGISLVPSSWQSLICLLSCWASLFQKINKWNIICDLLKLPPFINIIF